MNELYNNYLILFLKKCFFRLIPLIIVLSLTTSWLKSETVNQIFMRINYDKLYTYDKIENPTAIDSLQYIRNLAHIMYNYCDSTTVAYHKDIVERVYKVYPYVRHNFSPFNDYNGELIGGFMKIFTAEEESLSYEQNCLIKLHEMWFDLTCKLFQYMDDDEKTFSINMVAASYFNKDIRHEIVNNWIKHIQSIGASNEYSSCAKLLHFLSYTLSSNGKHKIALRIETALQEKCEILAYRSNCRIFQIRYVSIGQIAG